MTKQIFASMLVVLMLPLCFMFTACGNKKFYANVPLDEVYNATLTHYLEVEQDGHPENKDKMTDLYAIAQKYETIAGESRFVTYIEWRSINDWYNNSTLADTDYEFHYLHIADKVFVWYEAENRWLTEAQADALGSVDPDFIHYREYSKVYSNRTDSFSFRYMMESPIILYVGATNREFPDRYKTATTNEYLEYVFPGDELFRISNDKYNVCIKYDYDTKCGSLTRHDATWNPGSTLVPHLTPDGHTTGATTEHIPHINLITAEMLAD